MRSQFFDSRLTFNATIFHVDYNDLQTQSIEDIQGVPTFRLTNVGRSRTQGLEIDFLSTPVDDLNIYGGVTFLDAKFADYPTATCYPGQTAALGCTGTPPRQDLSGAALSVPEIKLNVGGDWSFPMGSFAGLLETSYTWQSDVPSTDPETEIGAFGVLNLSAGVRSANGNWTVKVFVNNLLGEEYPTAVGNQFGNFGSQQAVDFLPARDFERYGGVRVTVEF
jgi:iron complex outermembrane receptor protein